jgi:hypothetical protein
MSAVAWPPSFDIHTLFGPDLTPPGGLDWNRIQAFARFALESFIGQIAIAFGGIDILGWKPFDFLADWGQARIAEAQANYIAATTAQNAANYANAQLTALLVTDVSGGVSINSSFDGSAAASLGGSWTQIYGGPGGGALGIDGQGNAVWYKSGGFYRASSAHYNTPLATDYQRGRIVLATVPEHASFGSNPLNSILLRTNAALDTFVYAELSDSGVTIGCVVSGAVTILQPLTCTVANGDTWDFYAGTEIDAREFIIKRNGVEQIRVTDSSAISQLGSSYLYAGMSAQAADKSVFTDQGLPGAVTAWGAIDRQAATH